MTIQKTIENIDRLASILEAKIKLDKERSNEKQLLWDSCLIKNREEK